MDQQRIEVMSGVDRAWLEMDSPANPMVVNALIDFAPPLSAEALRAALLTRLLHYPRFRQRADDQHSPPRWVEDAELLSDYHAHVEPPERWRPDGDLAAAVAQQINQPLDRALPLWRLFLYPRADGGLTVLVRVHHAIADGIALVQMLMALTDSGQRAAAKTPLVQLEHGRHGPLAGLIGRLDVLNRAAEKLIDFGREDLHHPGRIPAQLRELRGLLASAGRVLTLPQDNPQALRRPLSGQRVVAWTSAIALAPVRRYARAEGVKVNDVFLAAVTAAFARYLDEEGAPPRARQNLRVSVPVNLRPPSTEDLGNCFGLVLVDLPLGQNDRRKRLALVAERMAELKHSPTARSVLLALAAAGHLPVPLEKRLVAGVAGKSVAVVSNLRGPEQPLRIAGVTLRELVFWPPQAGGIGVGLSLFSYQRRVSVGISADQALLARPARWLELFQDELAAMLSPPSRKPVATKAKPRRVARRASPKTAASRRRAGAGP
jgi:diacylglycerol O-acyltransferase